jgi:DNA polymerase-3 subunit delta
MFIFLFGKDTLRLKQKLKEILSHYQKIHQTGLNLKILDAENSTFQDFKDVFQQTSMFKEKKLIVLKNVFSEELFKAELLKNKKTLKNLKDIIVIYQKGEPKKTDKLVVFLKNNGKFQNFEPLKGRKLEGWVKKEFEKEETRITPRALSKLIRFVGNDLWRMENEIKKLSFYKKSDTQIIEEKDVELLVKSKIETDIFRTIDSLAQKNKKLAFVLIDKHLEKGDNPLYLLSMINYQFRNLLLVKTGSSYRTKLHPFVLRKTRALARNFSLPELKKIYQKIFLADLNIKTGKVSASEAIKLLIAEI